MQPPTLLERDTELATLRQLFDRARDGTGASALVTGEAGIGKTALVRAFVHSAGEGRVLWGSCDDLLAPRPFGPLHDIARTVGGPIEAGLTEGADRGRLFGLILDELESPPRPTVLVVDDVHWADEATIDLLTFLGRRITDLPSLLILTYRPEEVTPGHPLISTVAAPAPYAVTRIELSPLSHRAVEELQDGSGVDLDVAAAFQLTRGNPFYVTELLASGWDANRVPSTVAQVILAQLGRLPEEARQAAELLSVIPSRAGIDLLDVCMPGWMEALEQAERVGLLTVAASTVAYRHELARHAVEDSLGDLRRRSMHRRVLAGLLELEEPEPSAIVHHAARSGDDGALARWGPVAARAASRAGAHREALGHYRRTVDVLHLIDEEERAPLYEELASECLNAGRHDDALEAIEHALAMRRGRNDPEGEARALVASSWVHWVEARRGDAYRLAQEAVQILDDVSEGRAHAFAYSHMARISMLDWRLADAEHWGERAIVLAEKHAEPFALAHALNTVGTARMFGGSLDGEALLEESIRVAKDALSAGALFGDFPLGSDPVLRAYINLATAAIETRRYDRARHALDDGVASAAASERVGHLDYLDATKARLLMETGELDEAIRLGDAVLSRSRQLGVSTVPAAYAAGRASLRKGDPGAERYLAQAWRVAEPSGELQRTARIVFARAELAWYRDRLDEVTGALRTAHSEAGELGFPWIAGEAAVWLSRAAMPLRDPGTIAEPHRLMLDESFTAAAELWAELGCPYERAECLTATGESSAMIDGLEILDELGAVPLARLTRSRLREMGVQGVPRGPRPTTRANPLGLTARQMEVLRLVAVGLTNYEIAERLYLSVRTVDHHVSAILMRLGVDNRQDAAEVVAAMDQGSTETSQPASRHGRS